MGSTTSDGHQHDEDLDEEVGLARPGGSQPGTAHRALRASLQFARRWQPDSWSPEATALVMVVALLTCLGLVMTFSASFVSSAQAGDPFGIVKRQVAFAVLGVPAFVATFNLRITVWRRAAWVMLPVSIVLLWLVLTPAGIERSGSQRWLGYGEFVFQPSEVAKLAVLLWLADVMVRKRPKDGGPHRLSHLFVPAMPLLAVISLLVMRQPDLGTTLLLALIVGLVLFVEGLPWRYLGGLGLAGFALAAWAATAVQYRADRIVGWLDPGADPTGTGYQLTQSLISMAGGGVFGEGLGSSRGKWNFIPNPETDFIYAVIGEELGLVGALLVLTLFGALLVVGLRVARRTPDPFGQVVAFAITGWVVGQALLNIMTVIGLLPITGVTLPLLSYGGTSLVSTLVALGILTSVARDVPPEPVVELPEGLLAPDTTSSEQVT